MNKNETILLGGASTLTLEDCFKIGNQYAEVHLHPKAKNMMLDSHRVLTDFLKKRLPVYGSNTHFGNQVNLPDTLLIKDPDEYKEGVNKRQLNLIESHNCGLGAEVSQEIVRVTMALRAHCLALGYSGVRPEVAEQLINFINKKIHPVVRTYGSVGASGDLIPLSAIASALCGLETDVYFMNKKVSAQQAIKMAELDKLNPEVREGLALANGTSFMTAIATLAAYKLQRLFNSMLASLALSLEALEIIGDAHHPLVHTLKRQKGEQEINNFFLNFWKGSQLIKKLDDIRKDISEKIKNKEIIEKIPGLQDYYSLRSVAQGFGPFKENLERAVAWIEGEINSVNDNPIISVKPPKIYHCANFMGYYVTDSCDILKMDIAQASTWLHAILANLVHPRKNSGLPANLVKQPGINNGFRPIQILAASLAVQNRKLAQAQQSFMLPTEGDNQDVNSLGTHAALDLKKSVDNLEYLVSILLLASVQALELRGLSLASLEARKIHRAIRKVSSFLNSDRSLTVDIEKVVVLMKEHGI
ncbi:MAG: aromatic amino acid ammonia-lyase [bacterium]|nr:aromatic amino acid ammonia-lyase [bacterium]